MKKTLLVTQFFPPFPGGAQNYFYQLCKHLPTESIVVLADDTYYEEFKELQPEFGFEVVYEPFFAKRFWPKWIKIIAHLIHYAHKYKIKMIWAGEVLPGGVATLIYSKIFRVPYFTTTHGADVLNPMRAKGLKGIWKRALLKPVLKHAQFVTANSEYTRQLLIDSGVPKEKTIVVYPTANHTPPASELAFSPIIDEVQKLKQDGYTIMLSTCRLVRRKGVDQVIKAMPYIRKKLDKVAYIVVGSGQYRPDLERFADETGGMIIFTGAAPDEDLKALYNMCDLFILMPRELHGLIEGFGIVYIEASLFGKPVIGSNVGGVPEAIVSFDGTNQDTATGLLVDDPMDNKEIAEKVITVLSNKELAQQLGENGAKYAQQFTWQKSADAIKEKLL